MHICIHTYIHTELYLCVYLQALTKKLTVGQHVWFYVCAPRASFFYWRCRPSRRPEAVVKHLGVGEFPQIRGPNLPPPTE